MEGSYFYVFAWSGWIVVTFFMQKGAERLYAAIMILLLLITAQAKIQIAEIVVAVPVLLLGMFGCFGIIRFSLWRKLYAVVASTVLAMVYAIFHLVELYDPIWIVIHQTWLLAGCLSYASLLLLREHAARLFLLMTGIVQGELFLAFILKPYGFRHVVGPLSTLDILACAAMILSVLHALFKTFVYIEQLKQKQVRERQG